MPRYSYHFQLIDPDQQGLARSNFSLNLARPIAVRGPQKLINRWVQCFFTTRGSDPINTSFGTSFTSLVGGNTTGSADDIRASIEIAVQDCNEQIRLIDARSPWLSPSERLSGATIILYNPIRSDAIEFWVEIRTTNNQRVNTLIAYAHLETTNG
jgi:hypothetical protein